MTRSIARSLCDSWASCRISSYAVQDYVKRYVYGSKHRKLYVGLSVASLVRGNVKIKYPVATVSRVALLYSFLLPNRFVYVVSITTLSTVNIVCRMTGNIVMSVSTVKLKLSEWPISYLSRIIKRFDVVPVQVAEKRHSWCSGTKRQSLLWNNWYSADYCCDVCNQSDVYKLIITRSPLNYVRNRFCCSCSLV